MQLELLTHNASDLDVVNAARVSFAQESDWERSLWPSRDEFTERLSERDAGLIGFLLRNRHGTPFEHGFFKFRVEAPIFVFREWHRHRVGHSYNEMSGRYVELEERFYEPTEFRIQQGKPGAYTYAEMPLDQYEEYLDVMRDSFTQSWEAYKTLLDGGMAKEQARAVLPVGIYSQMIWSCNPRSLMHFVGLRNSKHAQKEIRVLAEQAEGALRSAMPVTYAAFIGNGRTAP